MTETRTGVPTEEQIKRFWEKLGARYTPITVCSKCAHSDGGYWIIDGIGHRIYWAELSSMIDPTNLFKYAVPKLTHLNFIYHPNQKILYLAEAWYQGKTSSMGSNDPALALFWAINRAFEEVSK